MSEKQTVTITIETVRKLLNALEETHIAVGLTAGMLNKTAEDIVKAIKEAGLPVKSI